MTETLERLCLTVAALVAALAVAGVEPAARVLTDGAGVTIVIGLKASGRPAAALAPALRARLERPVQPADDAECG